MVLSDTQLGMLEQLCYINSAVAEKAGISGFKAIGASCENMTVSQILECFGEKELKMLESIESRSAVIEEKIKETEKESEVKKDERRR